MARSRREAIWTWIGERARGAMFAVLFVGFTGFARLVGESHPFNEMSMFAEPVRAGDHVVVRMASGELREVW
jgi:hypothetical protein